MIRDGAHRRVSARVRPQHSLRAGVTLLDEHPRVHVAVQVDGLIPPAGVREALVTHV